MNMYIKIMDDLNETINFKLRGLESIRDKKIELLKQRYEADLVKIEHEHEQAIKALNDNVKASLNNEGYMIRLMNAIRRIY